jgi:hypothetical protein
MHTRTVPYWSSYRSPIPRGRANRINRIRSSLTASKASLVSAISVATALARVLIAAVKAQWHHPLDCYFLLFLSSRLRGSMDCPRRRPLANAHARTCMITTMRARIHANRDRFVHRSWYGTCPVMHTRNGYAHQVIPVMHTRTAYAH